jgi:hypothetical protein
MPGYDLPGCIEVRITAGDPTMQRYCSRLGRGNQDLRGTEAAGSVQMRVSEASRGIWLFDCGVFFRLPWGLRLGRGFAKLGPYMPGFVGPTVVAAM